MNRRTSLPVAIFVTGVAVLCMLVLATGFLNPDWMLDTIGLIPYLGAIVVMLVCTVLSFYLNIPRTIRREL